MSQLRLSGRAQSDIDAIWDYLAIQSQSPQAAVRQTESIFERLSLLAENPLMGQARDDLRPGLRTFSAGNYVILFYPIANGVEVAGIVHGSQDIERMWSTDET